MAGSGGEHGESTGAILAAFLANMGIAVTKFIGFLITGASSLLAESIHSVADSSNQGLLFWGGKAAQKAPTELHQFGYGRSRYFWAFIVAAVLFSVGGVFSIASTTIGCVLWPWSSVATKPGSITVTFTFAAATSWRSASEKAFTPNFVRL
jgi:divalent metal cation (Fe/Co/Zn/Cd) transporter